MGGGNHDDEFLPYTDSIMASSDDDGVTFPYAVSEFYFQDKDDNFISFSKLPVQWNESESSSAEAGPIFLNGEVEVKAWKYDISTTCPEILVLSKDNYWIELEKPRKSYGNFIKSILISVHCLSFFKSQPEASEKSLWDHLSNVFSLYDIRPSENDLTGHIDFLREAVKRDETLSKSKVLATFLDGELNGEVDHFDPVCAICDNGGELICCEGKCFRSFHPSKNSEGAQDSNCESLRLTSEDLEIRYKCENCRYSVHQCFVCAKLGSSDKSKNTEVFRCSSATCSHFYHPQCVSNLLQKNDTEQQTLKEKIAAGEPFICPAHNCAVCKQTENEEVEDLQFAICRRCPKSYHRNCLPRVIKFDHEVGDDDVRAWDGLLTKNRALIYCIDHEIDPDLATPARTIIFRNTLNRITEQLSKLQLVDVLPL